MQKTLDNMLKMDIIYISETSNNTRTYYTFHYVQKTVWSS